MNKKQAVFDALTDRTGSFISGTRIAAALGVSRTAVWKQIKHLRREGYEIESAPRLGYRLVRAPDRLYPSQIKHMLKTRLLGSEIVYFDTIGSTNDEAMRLAAGGAPEGTVVVSEEQTRGKGRLGRSWLSPKYQGIWFSVILRPQVLPIETGLITLAAAAAVARAIAKETGLEAEIKWPNDVLIRGKKVAGVLSEMSAEQDKVHFVVVGLGTNANVEAKAFPAEWRQRATSLKEQLGRKIDRSRLLCSVLGSFEELYGLFQEREWQKIVDEWKEMSTTIGKEVKAKLFERTVIGVAIDVDENGQLILRLPNGNVLSLSAGEITYLR